MVECPWDGCDYESSELGIQQHHKRTHGESLTVETFTCDNCGEQYERQRSKERYFDGSYCSEDCKYEAVSNQLSDERVGDGNPMYGRDGEKHPHWKGGTITAYGSGWLEARRKSLRRDQYRCQDCGMTDGEHHDEYERQLEVHHITPVRHFDDKSDAHTTDNLVTLCQRCHLQRENNVYEPTSIEA